jgi:hypothetical protein
MDWCIRNERRLRNQDEKKAFREPGCIPRSKLNADIVGPERHRTLADPLKGLTFTPRSTALVASEKTQIVDIPALLGNYRTSRETV